jgi:hypothetical protein
MITKDDFVEYVYSFYGKNGIYPFEEYTVPVEKTEIDGLIVKLLVENNEWWSNFDSICREVIRDIMLHNRGLRSLEYSYYIETNYPQYLTTYERETETNGPD